MNKELKFNIFVKDNFDRALSAGGRHLRRFQSIAGGVARGVKSVFKGLFDWRTIIAGGGLLGGVGVAIKKAFDLETVRVQFKVLTGDMKTANKLLKELKAESDATPFEFDDYANAGRNLLAFGFAAHEVTGELRGLGDIAAGIGMPLGELAEIYGKARVQGRLFGEDINQLTGRGIPVITELAKIFGVAESEVKQLVEQGKVGFPQLQQVMQNLTGEGGKFNGMMKELSGTGNGLVSTLKGEWTGALQDFGSAFMDLSKGAIQGLIDRLKQLRADGTIEKWAQQGAKAAKVLANVMGDIFSGDQAERAKAFGQMGQIVKAMFTDAGTAFMDVVGPRLEQILEKIPGVSFEDKGPSLIDKGIAKNTANEMMRERYGRFWAFGSGFDKEKDGTVSSLISARQAERKGYENDILGDAGSGQDYGGGKFRLDDVLSGIAESRSGAIAQNELDQFARQAGERLAVWMKDPSLALKDGADALGLGGFLKGGKANSAVALSEQSSGGNQLSLSDIFTMAQDRKGQDELGTRTKPMFVTVAELEETEVS